MKKLHTKISKFIIALGFLMPLYQQGILSQLTQPSLLSLKNAIEDRSSTKFISAYSRLQASKVKESITPQAKGLINKWLIVEEDKLIVEKSYGKYNYGQIIYGTGMVALGFAGALKVLNLVDGFTFRIQVMLYPSHNVTAFGLVSGINILSTAGPLYFAYKGVKKALRGYYPKYYHTQDINELTKIKNTLTNDINE